MSGRTVLITGASRGIGAAAAERFAQQGDRVVLNYYRSKDEALNLAARLREQGAEVLPYCADVADSEQVNAMVAVAESRFGAVDVFVSNAGIAAQKLFTDITDEEWRRMMAVTVDAAFYGCRAVIPGMVRRQSGKIILVSSIWGMVGASCEVHYSTAKAALLGMTKALAKELGPSRIQVNCVAPGVIDTAMNGALTKADREQLMDETPLGRLGESWEAAESIAFLASPQADFITGQVLSPNGGLVI